MSTSRLDDSARGELLVINSMRSKASSRIKPSESLDDINDAKSTTSRLTTAYMSEATVSSPKKKKVKKIKAKTVKKSTKTKAIVEDIKKPETGSN